MATYRKLGNRWRAEVFMGGVRKSKVHDTKAEARRWAEQIEDGISGGLLSGKTKSVRDLLIDYRDRVSPEKKGSRWEQTRLNRWLKNLDDEMPWLEKRTDEVRPDDVGRWRDAIGQRLEPGSVLREMSLLRSVFEHARTELRWCVFNPVKDARKPKRPRPRDRVLLNGEEQALLDAMNYVEGEPPVTLAQECAYCMLLALETAMRSGELVSLTRRQLHAKHISLAETKNGDARDVPLTPRARELLAVLLKRTPKNPDARLFRLTDATRDVMFRAARSAAGIEGLNFHDLRRVAATRLAEKLTPMELSKMTGHRDLKVLMAVYYAKGAADIADKL